jgi:hypothetical protein
MLDMFFSIRYASLWNQTQEIPRPTRPRRRQQQQQQLERHLGFNSIENVRQKLRNRDHFETI